MKKIVALGCAAALVGGLAFAGEPAANVSVVSFTGNASVEWGVDLDTNKTGFKNDTWQEIKLKLFDAGEKSTTGDGDVWAELKVKVDDDSSVGPNGYVDGGYKGKKAFIDVATLHFGDFYVGIKSGDVATGELDISTALRAPGFWQNPGRWLTNVGPAQSQGLTFGYGNSNITAEVDFRSVARYEDDYALSAELKLKDSNEWVGGLEAKAGVSFEFDSKDVYYSASAAYKASIGDDMYLKPAAGVTGAKDGDPTIAGGILLGWGNTQAYGSVNVPYFTDDASRGVTPGVSVVAKKTINQDGIVIAPSFYLGNKVENLRAAAYAEIYIPEVDGIDNMIAVAGGCAYDIKSDDLTITVKAGARYANDDYVTVLALGDFVPGQTKFFDKMGSAGEDYLNVTAGVDVAGLINNTTFYAIYASDNLNAADGAAKSLGTCNVGCKISF